MSISTSCIKTSTTTTKQLLRWFLARSGAQQALILHVYASQCCIPHDQSHWWWFWKTSKVPRGSGGEVVKLKFSDISSAAAPNQAKNEALSPSQAAFPWRLENLNIALKSWWWKTANPGEKRLKRFAALMRRVHAEVRRKSVVETLFSHLHVSGRDVRRHVTSLQVIKEKEIHKPLSKFSAVWVDGSTPWRGEPLVQRSGNNCAADNLSPSNKAAASVAQWLSRPCAPQLLRHRTKITHEAIAHSVVSLWPTMLHFWSWCCFLLFFLVPFDWFVLRSSEPLVFRHGCSCAHPHLQGCCWRARQLGGAATPQGFQLA